MGKEAKLGLAVIAILLVVLGAVLINRLSGTDDSEDMAANESAEEESGSDDTSDAKGGSGSATVVKTPGLSIRPPDYSPGSGGGMQDPRMQGGGYDTRPPASSALIPSHTGDTNPTDTQDPPVPPAPSVWKPPGAATSQADDPYADRTSEPLAQDSDSRYSVRVIPGPVRSEQGYNSGTTSQAGTAESGDSQLPLGGSSQYQEPRYTYRPSTIPSRAAPDNSMNPRVNQGYPYQSPTDPNYPTRQMSPYNPPYGDPYDSTPLPSAGGEYEVQPNDSYWTISQKLYGTGAYFKALAEHNRSRVPREQNLQLGVAILTPEVQDLETEYPDLCPKPERREILVQRATTVSTNQLLSGGPTYTVEEGDTLFDIAKHELGDVKRWVEIYNLNREAIGKDYHYIVPGLNLAMPGGGPTDTLTQRNNATSPARSY